MTLALDAGDRATARLVPAAARQRATLRERGHRPWPVPDGPWLMGQTWENLLFAHWPIATEALRPLVPPALALDGFAGSAWVAVTPFEVRGLRLRGTPPLPGLSRFPELNVRTYVTVEGKPGVYFFSLDAGSRLAVAAARRLYHLPYFRAHMRIRASAGWIDFVSRRVGDDEPAFAARYRPGGAASPPARGSLEHWLTERYCLYTLDDQGRVRRGEIHHPPWPLQPAHAEIERNTMARPLRIDLPGEPRVHFARRQDVVVWPPARASGPG